MRRRELLALSGAVALGAPAEPLRLAIVGLVHGHVDGFLRSAVRRSDIRVVGLSDPDASLHAKYADRHSLAPSLFHSALTDMLDKTKPEAVAVFTHTADHAPAAEACAARKLPVMMEKPLAVNNRQAARIASAARSSGIPVIVNYETTWYPSHKLIRTMMGEQKRAGDIRRMVAMDGHQGPKEIGVGPEFLGWLTDPEKNGAGALFDFGCYGANLMTWMMGDQRPLSVTAVAKSIKPEIYSRVDDDATILLEYPKAQGVIEASWNWPFSRKDFEVYGESGYAIATGGNNIRSRLAKGREESIAPEPLPADESDPVSYLVSVARGGRKPAGLSSLANNLIVTEILSAARESAYSGRRIVFRPQ